MRLWYTYGGKNRLVLEQLVAGFNAAQAEHWVQPVFQGDYYEGLAKLRTALAAGAAPALSHVVGEVIPYLAEAGVLEPLATRPGVDQLDLLPALGQAGTWRGGGQRPLVCLPFNRSTPIAFYDADVFEREGIAPPESWQALLEAARWLSTTDASGARRYGFACPIDWWFWAALVGQAGGELIEADGRISLGGVAGIKALELWQRMVNEDRSMKPPPGRDYNAWEATNQDFLAGRSVMIWTSTAFVRYLEDNARFNVRAAKLPGFVRRAVPTGGTHWILLRAAPEPEKAGAWQFLRYLHEPAQVARWATSTGYIPTTQSAVRRLTEAGHYAEHPNDAVALAQLDVAQPWPWSPRLFQLQREIIQPRLEAAVLGRQSPRAVMQDAVRLAQREP